MPSPPSELLFLILAFLLLASSFFSSAETGLLSVDRYKLLAAAREGHRGAQRIRRLLRRKDRLLSLILVGNNVANIGASVIATLLSLRLLGDSGPLIAAALLTCYMLIFAEIAPKTLAALYPEKIAYPASALLVPLSWLLAPLVKVLNYISNTLLRLLGVNPNKEEAEPQLDRKTLLHVLSDKNNALHEKHRELMLNTLYIEDTTVNDVMIPRQDIISIDLHANDQEFKKVLLKLLDKPYGFMTVYQETQDNIIGVIDIPIAAKLLNKKITRRAIRASLQEPDFVLEHTSLLDAIYLPGKEGKLVVLITDEYGVIQGGISRPLIGQEIFSMGHMLFEEDGIYANENENEKDDSVFVDGAANVRDINRYMKWDLPVQNDISTLNGLLLKHLEKLPAEKFSVLIDDYVITIIKLRKNGLVERASIKRVNNEQDEQADDQDTKHSTKNIAKKNLK